MLRVWRRPRPVLDLLDEQVLLHVLRRGQRFRTWPRPALFLLVLVERRDWTLFLPCLRLLQLFLCILEFCCNSGLGLVNLFWLIVARAAYSCGSRPPQYFKINTPSHPCDLKFMAAFKASRADWAFLILMMAISSSPSLGDFKRSGWYSIIILLNAVSIVFLDISVSCAIVGVGRSSASKGLISSSTSTELSALSFFRSTMPESPNSCSGSSALTLLGGIGASIGIRRRKAQSWVARWDKNWAQSGDLKKMAAGTNRLLVVQFASSAHDTRRGSLGILVIIGRSEFVTIRPWRHFAQQGHPHLYTCGVIA